MAVVMASPTFFPRRINLYVEAMQYADGVNEVSASRIPLGAPPAAVSNNIVNAQALSTTLTTIVDLTNNINAQGILDPWGRCIQIVCSVANTTVAVLRGADYLGQPMTETLAFAGAVAVQSKKCFKYLDRVDAAALAAGGTFSVGWGTGLGLPYKTIRVTAEIANGAAVATAPVLNTNFFPASLVDPQTTGTTDPRGKYVPITALNGVNVISIVADCVNDVNSSQRGGLHGIRHVFA